MSLLSLFAAAVFAAESVLSPIPDNTPVVVPTPPKPEVSFGQIVAIPTPLAEPDPAPQDTPTPTPPPLMTAKKSYTIAFLGDSMTDTMGPGLPAVQSRLSSLYRATDFTLLNYGVGGTNIDYGIERITSGYTYLGNPIPSLASARPDIVVLESFAYNPFPDADGGVTRHWLALGRAVDTLRASIPGVKIVIAATIAPHVSDVMSQDHVRVIQSYLESTTAFAKSQGFPLADAYHGSVEAHTNPGDHIHYSDAGRALFAAKIVAALKSVL
jgi:lysophospholipase L1-like esterase